MQKSEFTPTQQAMIDLLADGKAHSRHELKDCLADELSPLSAIRAHLSNLRKVLRCKGQDVICELVNRRICYRHVVILTSLDSKNA